MSHFKTWYREKSRRIDTYGKLSEDEVATNGCNGYEPIMYECLDRLFRSIPVGVDDVLIDYGSGKGRVLIEATRYPFKRIEGVEYDQQLVLDCERNFRNFDSGLLADRVWIHHCDAREFEIPDDATHLFIWNSFEGEVLKDVAKKILAFATHAPRQVHLVVALPSGETTSLTEFESFSTPDLIKTRFWTGVDIYHMTM